MVARFSVSLNANAPLCRWRTSRISENCRRLGIEVPPALLAIVDEVIKRCLRAPPLLTLMRSMLRRGRPKWRRWFGVDIKRK